MLFIKKMNMCSLGGNTNNKEGATLRPESDHRRCLKGLVLVRSFKHLLIQIHTHVVIRCYFYQR